MSGPDPATRPTVFAPGLFQGRVALVSGGSGGIGGATAWLLARLGAHVVVTGRNTARLEEMASAMEAAGVSAEVHALNVRDGAACAERLDQIWEAHGRLDILVNSAGGQFPSPAIDIPDKGWNAVIDTNLNGTWRLTQGAAQRWRDHGLAGGQADAVILNIIVVTSHGLYGIAHSQAARAGVETLSKHLAVEWAQYGIRVNCIAPGPIETPGWRVYERDALEKTIVQNPMKRAGTVWDIAEACAYLASPAANYITGITHTVDGGGQHWGEQWTSGRPNWYGG